MSDTPLDVQQTNLQAMNYVKAVGQGQLPTPEAIRITLLDAAAFGAGIEGLAFTLATIVQLCVASLSDVATSLGDPPVSEDQIWSQLKTTLAPDVAD